MRNWKSLNHIQTKLHILSNNWLYGCHVGMLFKCISQHVYCLRPMNLSSQYQFQKVKIMSTVGDSDNYRAIAIGIINGNIIDNVILFKT